MLSKEERAPGGIGKGISGFHAASPGHNQNVLLVTSGGLVSAQMDGFTYPWVHLSMVFSFHGGLGIGQL